MRTSERKTIEAKIERIDVQLKELRLVKNANKERAALLLECRRLDGRLAKSRKEGMPVSDHAVVRYMERVHGIDIEEIKREIVGGDRKGMSLPNGQFGVSGHKIRVVNGVVVTVVVRDDERD